MFSFLNSVLVWFMSKKVICLSNWMFRFVGLPGNSFHNAELCARCSLLVTFCPLLVTFCLSLVTFCLLVVIFCLMFVTFCSLLVTFCSLLVSRYYLLVARYFLLVACYFLLAARQEILKDVFFFWLKVNQEVLHINL